MKQALNESVGRVIAGAASLLPGFVALLVALTTAALVGWLMAFVVRRFLRGIDFDSRVNRIGLSGLAELAPGKSPTLLLARTTLWL
ncbi:MAG TPA: hypothetical protein VLD58_14060, partial [Gemmatimonadales bacterium]|nr:hypothetical protein [Gemmatimonadales bacterium]